MNIKGAVALVTGGASGLGEATVRRLSKEGARVVIVDSDEARGQVLAKELDTTYVKVDITSIDEVEAAVIAAGKLGELRIAVGCAGMSWATRTLSNDGSPHALDLFQTHIEINLIGTFNVLRLAAAQMAKNELTDSGERGVCIRTASVAAFDGQMGQAAYAASKAGVVGLTLPVARDLSQVGIRVMTIAPGIFDTPMMAMVAPRMRQALSDGVPFPRRLGQPAEYAQLVVSIVENAYLNGETIRLDGALRMATR